MNITCDQCGKRYKMKAEQTKKAFKTRCKRCSNVIIVRPEDHQSSTATAGVQPAAESAQAQWYAVVNGQQSGPFTEAQVSEYLVAGSLDAQSFVWCEGMSNWEAISSVPQLNALLPRAATPAPVTSAPVPNSMSSSVSADDSMSTSQSSPKPEQQSAPQPALSMGVQIGHNRDLLAQVASQTPETAQVFASSESSASAQVMFDAPESQSGAQLSNQRNENSVLFSLDSIDSMGS
jgi:DNA-directed RNA polymerase subunit RPC12/RpoP